MWKAIIKTCAVEHTYGIGDMLPKFYCYNQLLLCVDYATVLEILMVAGRPPSPPCYF